MKEFKPLLVLVALAAVVIFVRRAIRGRVLAYQGPRLDAGNAHRNGLTWFGLPTLIALALFAGGVAGLVAGGNARLVGYPIAAILVVGYAPYACLGAPKLTKWQKSYERRLVAAGASPQGAQKLAPWARAASGVGLLLTLGALVLVSYPSS